jgi:putative ABC transport system permease protein
VGARRRDVRNQFVIEAFVLSLAGGITGVLLGVAIAQGVAAYAGWATVVTAGSILLATGVSIGVGLIFGIYPAWRAAELDPIEALRHE